MGHTETRSVERIVEHIDIRAGSTRMKPASSRGQRVDIERRTFGTIKDELVDEGKGASAKGIQSRAIGLGTTVSKAVVIAPDVQ